MGIVSHVQVVRGQVVEEFGVLGVVHARGPFLDRQHIAEHRLGAGVVALGLVQRGQVVKGYSVFGVMHAQSQLHDRQCLAKFWLRSSIVAHVLVHGCQSTEGKGVIGVVVTQQLAPKLHGLAARGDALWVLLLVSKRVCEPDESIRFLEPLPLDGVERRTPVQVGKRTACVANPPILRVRLPLAYPEHLRERFPGLSPVLAELLNCRHVTERGSPLVRACRLAPRGRWPAPS